MNRDTDTALDLLVKLIALMKENKLDVLEFDSIKLVKTNHADAALEFPIEKPSGKTAEELEDEILFHSS